MLDQVCFTPEDESTGVVRSHISERLRCGIMLDASIIFFIMV